MDREARLHHAKHRIPDEFVATDPAWSGVASKIRSLESALDTIESRYYNEPQKKRSLDIKGKVEEISKRIEGMGKPPPGKPHDGALGELRALQEANAQLHEARGELWKKLELESARGKAALAELATLKSQLQASQEREQQHQQFKAQVSQGAFQLHNTLVRAEVLGFGGRGEASADGDVLRCLALCTEGVEGGVSQKVKSAVDSAARDKEWKHSQLVRDLEQQLTGARTECERLRESVAALQQHNTRLAQRAEPHKAPLPSAGPDVSFTQFTRPESDIVVKEFEHAYETLQRSCTKFCHRLSEINTTDSVYEMPIAHLLQAASCNSTRKYEGFLDMLSSYQTVALTIAEEVRSKAAYQKNHLDVLNQQIQIAQLDLKKSEKSLRVLYDSVDSAVNTIASNQLDEELNSREASPCDELLGAVGGAHVGDTAKGIGRWVTLLTQRVAALLTHASAVRRDAAVVEMLGKTMDSLVGTIPPSARNAQLDSQVDQFLKHNYPSSSMGNAPPKMQQIKDLVSILISYKGLWDHNAELVEMQRICAEWLGHVLPNTSWKGVLANSCSSHSPTSSMMATPVKSPTKELPTTIVEMPPPSAPLAPIFPASHSVKSSLGEGCVQLKLRLDEFSAQISAFVTNVKLELSASRHVSESVMPLLLQCAGIEEGHFGEGLASCCNWLRTEDAERRRLRKELEDCRREQRDVCAVVAAKCPALCDFLAQVRASAHGDSSPFTLPLSSHIHAFAAQEAATREPSPVKRGVERLNVSVASEESVKTAVEDLFNDLDMQTAAARGVFDVFRRELDQERRRRGEAEERAKQHQKRLKALNVSLVSACLLLGIETDPQPSLLHSSQREGAGGLPPIPNAPGSSQYCINVDEVCAKVQALVNERAACAAERDDLHEKLLKSREVERDIRERFMTLEKCTLQLTNAILEILSDYPCLPAKDILPADDKPKKPRGKGPIEQTNFDHVMETLRQFRAFVNHMKDSHASHATHRDGLTSLLSVVDDIVEKLPCGERSEDLPSHSPGPLSQAALTRSLTSPDVLERLHGVVYMCECQGIPNPTVCLVQRLSFRLSAAAEERKRMHWFEQHCVGLVNMLQLLPDGPSGDDDWSTTIPAMTSDEICSVLHCIRDSISKVTADGKANAASLERERCEAAAERAAVHERHTAETASLRDQFEAEVRRLRTQFEQEVHKEREERQKENSEYLEAKAREWEERTAERHNAALEKDHLVQELAALRDAFRKEESRFQLADKEIAESRLQVAKLQQYLEDERESVAHEKHVQKELSANTELLETALVKLSKAIFELEMPESKGEEEGRKEGAYAMATLALHHVDKLRYELQSNGVQLTQNKHQISECLETIQLLIAKLESMNTTILSIASMVDCKNAWRDNDSGKSNIRGFGEGVLRQIASFLRDLYTQLQPIPLALQELGASVVHHGEAKEDFRKPAPQGPAGDADLASCVASVEGGLVELRGLIKDTHYFSSSAELRRVTALLQLIDGRSTSDVVKDFAPPSRTAQLPHLPEGGYYNYIESRIKNINQHLEEMREETKKYKSECSSYNGKCKAMADYFSTFFLGILSGDLAQLPHNDAIDDTLLQYASQVRKKFSDMKHKITGFQDEFSETDSKIIMLKQDTICMLEKVEDCVQQEDVRLMDAWLSDVEGKPLHFYPSSPVKEGAVHEGVDGLRVLSKFLSVRLSEMCSIISIAAFHCLKISRQAKAAEEQGKPEVQKLERKLASVVERVNELHNEINERDLHLSVVMESEKQTRQLYVLLKEKMTQEIKSLEDENRHMQATQEANRMLKEQNDYYSSNLALTRNELNSLRAFLESLPASTVPAALLQPQAVVHTKTEAGDTARLSTSRRVSPVENANLNHMQQVLDALIANNIARQDP